MTVDCSPEAVALRQAQLDSLNAARVRLLTGEAVRVHVDANGERVEFQGANIGQLNGLIQQLQVEMQMCSCPRHAPVLTRPIRVFF